MIVTLQTERVQTLAEVRAVIDGNDRLDYQFTDREAAYEFIRRTLVRFDYPTLSKPDKGIIRRYLAKMTGLSRAQMTRLVGQHRATGRVTDRRGGAPVRPFERRYTGADIRRLWPRRTRLSATCPAPPRGRSGYVTRASLSDGPCRGSMERKAPAGRESAGTSSGSSRTAAAAGRAVRPASRRRPAGCRARAAPRVSPCGPSAERGETSRTGEDADVAIPGVGIEVEVAGSDGLSVEDARPGPRCFRAKQHERDGGLRARGTSVVHRC